MFCLLERHLITTSWLLRHPRGHLIIFISNRSIQDGMFVAFFFKYSKPHRVHLWWRRWLFAVFGICVLKDSGKWWLSQVSKLLYKECFVFIQCLLMLNGILTATSNEQGGVETRNIHFIFFDILVNIMQLRLQSNHSLMMSSGLSRLGLRLYRPAIKGVA